MAASSDPTLPYSYWSKVIGYHKESKRVGIGCCTFLECSQYSMTSLHFHSKVGMDSADENWSQVSPGYTTALSWPGKCHARNQKLTTTIVGAVPVDDVLAGLVGYQMVHLDLYSFTIAITDSACTATSFSSDATKIKISSSNFHTIQVITANSWLSFGSIELVEDIQYLGCLRSLSSDNIWEPSHSTADWCLNYS